MSYKCSFIMIQRKFKGLLMRKQWSNYQSKECTLYKQPEQNLIYFPWQLYLGVSAGAEQDMTCSIIIHLWCLCQIITEKHMCATVLSTAPWDPRHILGEQARRRGTVYRRHVYSIALPAHTDDLHFSFFIGKWQRRQIYFWVVTNGVALRRCVSLP